MDPSYGQLLGFQTHENEDGTWTTTLQLAVRNEAPPDMGTLARWISQVNRSTNSKLGASAVPMPVRRRLPAPAVTPA